MPGRTRLYSEFIAQDSELDSNVTRISDLHKSRVPLTRLVESDKQDFGPSFKRYKTTGLNARFDRMLERVNLTLQDPQASSTIASSRQGRIRALSAGSSSVSSGYDIPKTPVDAYDALEEGRLGHTFSVLKMKSAIGEKSGGYYRAGEGYDGSSDMQSEESDQIIPITHKAPLPEWLAITFSKLDSQNPLRRLISPSTQPIPETALPHEEPIFAFSHIPQDLDGSAAENAFFTYRDAQDSTPQDWQEPMPMDQQSHLNFPLPNICSQDPITNCSAPRMLQPIALPSSDIDLLPLPDIEHVPLPFSTPGPGSTVSLALSHDDSRPGVSAQAINRADQEDGGVWPVFAMSGAFAHLPIAQTAHHALASTFPHHSATAQPEPNSEPVHVPASSSSYLFYDDFATDLSSSDPPPFPITIHERSPTMQLPPIKNPFSTPGPRFHALLSRPVYFDSPAEDPTDSDPLAPPEGYELDELDFRWEPFIQKDVDGGYAGSMSDEWDSSADFDQESVDNPMAVCFEVRKDTPEPEMSEMPEDQASITNPDYNVYSISARHGSGHLPPYLQGFDHSGEAEPPVTPEPTKIETSFAPAPGIFISPLRNEPISPVVQKKNVDLPPKPPNSQTPIPVTPRNKSTTRPGVLNTTSLPTDTSVLKSRSKLPPNQPPSQTSTSILPCSDAVTSRSIDINYVDKMTEVEVDFITQGVLSQVSNDSIASWSEERGDGR